MDGMLQCPKSDDGQYFVWRRYEIFRLSAHFMSTELRCPCGCIEQKIAVELINRLELVHKDMKRPMYFAPGGGYRCSKYQQSLRDKYTKAGVPGNTAVGQSTHELGHAADPGCADPELNKILQRTCRKYFKAIGKGRNFTHVDLRDDKPREWSYA